MAVEQAAAPIALPVIPARPGSSEGVRGLIRRSPLGTAALCSLVLVILMAVFADYVAPFDPLEGNYSAVRRAPSATHWFGTDDIGRDVLSRVIHGARISLLVGFASVFLGDLIGLSWGIASGYIGRRFDLLSQRVLEVLFAFPGLILATMLMLVLGAGLTTVIVAVAATRMPASMRIIRGVTLAVKELAYVDAARVAGAAPLRVMFCHIAPACLAPFLIVVSAHLGIAITTEAALSFVGVGVPPPAPSWGTMLAGSAVGKFNPLWWQAVFPGMAITLTVLAMNLAGDALRDLMDPQLRRRVG
ncbi:MAG: ABC transporter permease [Chloroflexota bacterium]